MSRWVLVSLRVEAGSEMRCVVSENPFPGAARELWGRAVGESCGRHACSLILPRIIPLWLPLHHSVNRRESAHPQDVHASSCHLIYKSPLCIYTVIAISEGVTVVVGGERTNRKGREKNPLHISMLL